MISQRACVCLKICRSNAPNIKLLTDIFVCVQLQYRKPKSRQILCHGLSSGPSFTIGFFLSTNNLVCSVFLIYFTMSKNNNCFGIFHSPPATQSQISLIFFFNIRSFISSPSSSNLFNRKSLNMFSCVSSAQTIKLPALNVFAMGTFCCESSRIFLNIQIQNQIISITNDILTEPLLLSNGWGQRLICARHHLARYQCQILCPLCDIVHHHSYILIYYFYKCRGKN